MFTDSYSFNGLDNFEMEIFVIELKNKIKNQSYILKDWKEHLITFHLQYSQSNLKIHKDSQFF